MTTSMLMIDVVVAAVVANLSGSFYCSGVDRCEPFIAFLKRLFNEEILK